MTDRMTPLERLREGGSLSTRLGHVKELLDRGDIAAAQTLLADCYARACQLEYEARRLDEKAHPAFGR